jgi:ribosomal protein S18 acetylase RimI-like enzyme
VEILDGRVDSDGQLSFTGVPAELVDELLAHSEARARERGLLRLRAILEPDDAALDTFVRRSGFAQRGEVLRMWRPVSSPVEEPPWPGGALVRTYEDRDARPLQSLLDTAYGAWDDTYVARPHEDWLRWMTGHDEFDPTLWFLVERGDDLVGCALHWKEQRRAGWLKDLVVRADQRGSGIGTALIEQGLHAYARRGVERVGLKVDSTNPTGAVRLYERSGFEVDRRYGIWVKEL